VLPGRKIGYNTPLVIMGKEDTFTERGIQPGQGKKGTWKREEQRAYREEAEGVS
jgi:hypothetical protein